MNLEPRTLNLERPAVDAVIFDIGRVLIDFDFERAFSAAERMTGIAAREIRARIFGGGDFSGVDRMRDVVAFECGRLSGPEFHACVERLLRRTIPFQAFREIWNGIFTHEIEATIALLRTLQADPRLKVGVLSNTNALHFEHLRARMKCLGEIRHLYASHEIGCRKPDAASYQFVLREMCVAPRRTVFVDDLAENVAAARDAGLIGIHATSAEAVRGGLAELGLV